MMAAAKILASSVFTLKPQRTTYTPVIAAGTPIVSTWLVGFSQLDILASPSHSLVDIKKADFDIILHAHHRLLCLSMAGESLKFWRELCHLGNGNENVLVEMTGLLADAKP
jgi:hypothetical protein